MPEIDIDHLRGWIGRGREVEDIVTPRLVAEYRATLAPHLAPVASGEAPLALHWCLAPETPAADALGPDGHAAKGGFLPPVPLPRRMWAGGEIETLAPLRVGDRVVRRETVSDVAVKHGRTGTLCFVTVRHEYETARGLAIRDRQDIVYREASRPGDAAPTAKPVPAEDEAAWSVEANSVLLFRYSAMTFNGHRFHYDHPYATQVEGYPGLVVHGPMQASLLLNLAALRLGRVPARFRYRGVAPMIAGSRFAVAGRREGQGEAFQGWTAVDGAVCMEAEAEG
ncbi:MULTISPECIES: MaoC family dehydratase N-terminal domain-containing protein [Methylobacterium]|jgi:3-methylfumaryl-CoA hydratase|uniref:FAS1-like dehydratase domain-containing protein n=3 Tax=Methylobacteriaceae TaxID=119045 RepID=UPI0008EAAD3B|nr:MULTISPECIES: MaoC family dehydratase N-terminal domain-containing protein [Methylobacterium]MBK3396117.1 MaoC family dehydratase N-terminal domain-containing protein [Methylobacterium ajmalii]MBK3410966.1 MaoC family dehydratase N-terminal domain-containing protein [Methylobacterium ajmalii]MBZ6416285.1 MaoC family dehydratase N-terminal domain-containing protein [Methylobacterium sp.]SFE81927.1 3-methylfumaryl-CoA hydratase [Methylobacterium sp. yr596]